MFEEVKKKKSLFSDFHITDRESCEKAIRNGGIAALISAGITAVFGIAGMFTGSDDAALAYMLDPWILVDAILLVVLALFVFRKSRVAATSLLIYFVITKIMMWVEFGAPRGLLVAAIFFMFYLTAARGTYLWHSEYRPAGADAAGSPSAGRREPLGVALCLFIAFFLLMGIFSVALIPSSYEAWSVDPSVWTMGELLLVSISAVVCLALTFMIPARTRSTPTIARLFFFGRALVATFLVFYITVVIGGPFDEAVTGIVAGNIVMLLLSILGFGYWNFSSRVGRVFSPASSMVNARRPAVLPSTAARLPVATRQPSPVSSFAPPDPTVSPEETEPTIAPEPVPHPSESRLADQRPHDPAPASDGSDRAKLCYTCGYRNPLSAVSCAGCSRLLPGAAYPTMG